MLNMTSFYSSKEHTIIGGGVAEFCSRLVSGSFQWENKLFVVRYNELGVFCICEWLGKPFDVFVDKMNLGNSLNNFTRAKVCELRQRLFSPLTAEGTAQALDQEESDYLHQLQDEDQEESERLVKSAVGD